MAVVPALSSNPNWERQRWRPQRAGLPPSARGALFPFRDPLQARMLGPGNTWAGDFLSQRQADPGSRAAQGKTGVSLGPQVLLSDIQAQWGVPFPSLAWATGWPQRSPGIKGRESFPAAPQCSFSESDVLFLQTSHNFRSWGSPWS